MTKKQLTRFFIVSALISSVGVHIGWVFKRLAEYRSGLIEQGKREGIQLVGQQIKSKIEKEGQITLTFSMSNGEPENFILERKKK